MRENGSVGSMDVVIESGLPLVIVDDDDRRRRRPILRAGVFLGIRGPQIVHSSFPLLDYEFISILVSLGGR